MQEPRGRRGNIKQGNSYLPLTKGTNYAREVLPRMLGSTSRGQGALEITKKIIYAQKSLKRESHRHRASISNMAIGNTKDDSF